MKTISNGLLAHYQSGGTTLAHCWKITRTDGKVFGFTSLDVDLMVNDVLYLASSGFTPSAIESKADLSVANMEVTGFLQSATITESDLKAGVWDGAECLEFECNYRDLTQGTVILSHGTLGQVRALRQNFVAEIRGVGQKLQQRFGRIVTPACAYVLGDASCRVNLASLTATGAITGVVDTQTFSDNSRVEVSGYFNYGNLTFTSGANAGHSMEVKTFSYGEFVTQLAFGKTVAIGDTYTVTPGCNKLLKMPVGVSPIRGSAITGTPWASSSNNSFQDRYRYENTGIFNGGILTWLTGRNAGQVVTVSTYTLGVLGGTFTLATNLPYPVLSTEQYTCTAPLSQQSNQSIGTYTGDCKVKYNNVINFGGFPEVPGLDRIVGNGNQ